MLLQPTEQSLDNVALPVVGFVEQARQPRFRFALQESLGHHGLHAIPVAELPQRFRVIAVVRY